MTQHLRPPVVGEFLRDVLAGGAVGVSELEVMARTAGLLGERQRISDAKIFKLVKKQLCISSRRDGFGRGGEWLWELPPAPKTTLVETAADKAPKVPVSVTYADHSRPNNVPKVPPAVAYGEGSRSDNAPEVTPAVVYADLSSDEGVEGDRIPSQWLRSIASLDLARTPRDMPPHRWRLFVGDCQAFLTSSKRWALRAAELGWNASSLFGCCSVRPLDHFGSAGLLWTVAGGKLIRLHKDWARIAAVGGAERIFHRRPSTMTNVTLPWRLR